MVSSGSVRGSGGSTRESTLSMSVIQPPDPEDGDAAESSDGRSRRRDRNREAVIHAMLELIRGGDYNPATADIAELAGVSHRSVFRYFDDLGDLVREAIHIEFERAIELGAIDDLGAGPLPHRVDALIAIRIKVYDGMFEVCRVARLKSEQLPDLDTALSEVTGLARRQVVRQFGRELSCMDDDRRDHVVDTIVALTDFAAYDLLRRWLGRDDERIAATWHDALTALLTTDPTAG